MSTRSARCVPLLVVFVPACVFVVDGGDWGDNALRGSGVRVEEDRQVSEFHAVELETSANVVVKVGEAPSVHLSGDDNLLVVVLTEVRGGVLAIDLAHPCRFRSDLEIVIGTPSLERFTIEGSGDVQIQDVSANELELAIEGSGTIRARGSAADLSGSIEGSGTLSLAELHSTSADLSIEGSGSMEVHVAKALRYSIEGSGDIRYAGEPHIRGDIDGSGSVGKSR